MSTPTRVHESLAYVSEWTASIPQITTFVISQFASWFARASGRSLVFSRDSPHTPWSCSNGGVGAPDVQSTWESIFDYHIPCTPDDLAKSVPKTGQAGPVRSWTYLDDASVASS